MPSRRCRIALLGFGTVGSAVVRRLSGDDAPPDLELTHIFDRRAALKRSAYPSLSARWTTRVDDVLTSDVDVVVEAIGSVSPAAEWIEAAIAVGKSVVTANKQVIARDGARLLRCAARQGRQLRFEAAVGGAMPIVRAIADGLAGDRVTRIVAILNGTTNAVLSQMDETGCTLACAVADAQSRGLAEADPSSDLDGGDARAKLAILCALAFGIRVAPERVPVRSCARIGQEDLASARREGGTIRQIACAEYDHARATLTASVGPAVVPRASLFGRTTGPANAAVITGAHSGETGIFGIGAGGDPTSVAIISDIVAIARDRAAIVPAPSWTSNFTLQTSNFALQSSNFALPTSNFVLPEAV